MAQGVVWNLTPHGGTRMHDSPSKGVVDRDCRLHGSENFCIAGSSVFATGSSNFPTITLVALAIRLADRLASQHQASIRGLQNAAKKNQKGSY